MNSKEKIIIDTGDWSEEKLACAKLFAVAGTVPEDKAMEYSGISSNMLKTWEEQGLIEKVDTPKACFFRPTEYGEAHFVQATGNRCYKTGAGSGKHNYELLDRFHALDEEEKESYRTEADLKQYARERAGDFDEISTTDGAYIDSETGELHCIEIESKHYKDEHIAMKQVFVERMGGHYESYKI